MSPTDAVPDAMAAEFRRFCRGGTVAAVRELGDDHALPGACRGSGGPGALRWLARHLRVGPGMLLLDSGAGLGGPAAFAAAETGVAVVLVDPMVGACRAAAALFGRPTVVAPGEHLPVAADTADAAWSVGVLCTSGDQLSLLTELARVVRPGGGVGLLVYTRRVPHLDEQPQGNNFPIPSQLAQMVAAAGLVTRVEADLTQLAGPTTRWAAARRRGRRPRPARPRGRPALDRGRRPAPHHGTAHRIGTGRRGPLLVADVHRADH